MQVTKTYDNSMDLGDGSYLEIRVVVKQQRGGYVDPAEVDQEVYFRIDGKDLDREDLPPEVTADVIEELINSAR